MFKTRLLPAILALSIFALLTCSSELEIDFRGTVSDILSGLAVSGVQVWCMAVIDADTLVPLERDRPPALTQTDGSFRDVIATSAGTGCTEVTKEDIMREGAYYKFRRSGYEPVDTFLPREKLTRISGYYQLPRISMKPDPLVMPVDTQAVIP